MPGEPGFGRARAELHPGPASVSAAVLDVPVLDAQTAAAFLANRTGETGLVTAAELASSYVGCATAGHRPQNWLICSSVGGLFTL